MILENGKPVKVEAFIYNYQASMTAGTFSIKMSIGDAPFDEIEGASGAATANGTLDISEDTRIQADTTGDAIVRISRVRRSKS